MDIEKGNIAEEHSEENVFDEIEDIIRERQLRVALKNENKNPEAKGNEADLLSNCQEVCAAESEDGSSRNDIEIESMSDYQLSIGRSESRIEQIDEEFDEEDRPRSESPSEENGNIIYINYEKVNNEAREFWECPYCPYKATKLDLIHIHIPATHARVTCYKCQDCQYAHAQLSLIIEHIVRRHQKLKHQCPECKFQFSTIWNCQGHIMIRHPKKAEKLIQIVLEKRQLDGSYRRCPFCDYINDSSPALKRHVEKEHPDVIIYKCLYCTYKNKDIDDIADHMSEMHRGETVEEDF